MAATIEGAFVLVDRASGTMERMERQARKTMVAIEGVGAAQDHQSRRSQTAARAMESHASELKKSEQETAKLKRGMSDLSNEHQKSSTRVKSLENAYRGLRSEMGRLRAPSANSGGGGNSGILGGLGKDLKMARGAIGDFVGAFKTLGSSIMAFKVPAMGAGIALLGQSLLAVGGAAAAALPLLQAAGTALSAYPAAGAMAAQALGSVKLAFAGVMQAVNAGMQAQNQWALNQRDFQQQVVSAMDAVISAHQGLTNAIYDQQQAQLQLTVARRDAVRQLQDMEFAASTAVLKEARAGLDIQQAKMELQQAMMSPGTTQLQLQSLRLGVYEAQSSARQTHTESQRQRQDYRRARSGDPTAAPTMAVAQAQHAVSQSTLGIANAQRALARSQTALNILMSNGNAGLMAYKRSLMGLGPAAQAFVKFMVGGMGPGDKKSIVGQFQALQNAAGEGLFPGLKRGITELLGGMGVLKTNLRATGQVMGNFGAGLVNVFFGHQGLGQTNQIMHNNTQALGHLSGAGIAVAEMFRKLMIAAGPTLIWASKMIEAWAKMHDRMMSTADGQAKLQERFAKLRTIIKEMLTIFHELYRIFQGVADAAWGLNQTMMKGSETGLKKWADWANSTGGQNKMKAWFAGLLPILRSLKGLVEALAKGFVGLIGPGSTPGIAHLIDGFTKMVPLLQKILLSLESSFGKATVGGIGDVIKLVETLASNSGPFAIWLMIMDKVVKAITWLLKLPILGQGLVAFFAVLFAGSTIAKYSMGIGGVITKVLGLGAAWRKVGDAQKAGMNSPGTGHAPGLWNRVKGTAGGLATWGVRSGSGPGSLTNPLMVRVEGAATGFGRPTGGALQKAEQAGADVAKTGEVGAVGELSRAERVGAFLGGMPVVGSLFKKVPAIAGATSKAAGITDAAAVAAKAGGATAIAGDVGMVAKFGRVLGPLGAALTVLPGIISFINTKGSVGTKLGAAVNSTVSSATFGLINPHIGAPSKASQYAQGARRADASFAGFETDPLTGMLTARGMAQYRARINTLQGQYNVAAHGTPTVDRITGRTVMTGQDTAVRQDRFANITRLNNLVGGTDAQKWTEAFAQGIQNGQKPKQAMSMMITGLQQQMKLLSPGGKKVLMDSMATWGATLVRQNPQMKGPVDKLNSYITSSFQGMGLAVNNVNDQIMQQSGQQWQQISSGLVQPMAVAVTKLNGSFTQIQNEALNALAGMGYTKMQAKTLFGNVVAKSQGAQNINVTGMGSQHGGTNAAGGRVQGSNLRDVYQFGANTLGGGELVVNRHQEQDANARLMRHGEPTIGSIVSNRKTPHWFASGGRLEAFPFPKGTPFSWRRIDQGQDLEASPGSPVLAIGPGIVSQASDRFGGFGPFYPTEQITGGPLSGRGVYYGHTKIARTGQVQAGDVIAHTQTQANTWTAAPAGWLELGFLPYGSMSAGAAIAPFLHQLASGAQITGNFGGLGSSGSSGGLATQLMKALKTPKITGIGGAPLGLAQGGAGAYASGLTKYINKKLRAQGGGGAGGFNFGSVKGLGGSAGANEALGRQMMLAAGWGADQWPSLQALWTQESGWNSNAVNSSSGAYGIPQSLGHGHPYNLGDARAQIAWGLNYIKGRYGSPNAAEAHERSNNWYAGGGRIADAGWNSRGGTFTTNGPTVFGAGEGGRKETVTITPAGTGTAPIHIEIHRVEVHRKGDIKRIVDEELQLLADSLTKMNS